MEKPRHHARRGVLQVGLTNGKPSLPRSKVRADGLVLITGGVEAAVRLEAQ